MWYIQTMEYYSALKKKKKSNLEKKWRKLKYILLSERDQSEKAGRSKTLETVKRSVLTRLGGMSTEDF